MTIATFQNKSFQVSTNRVYTLNNLTWSGEIQSEEQEKINSKPSTYIKGIGLDSMSFEISLKAILGIDVRKEIEEWEAIKLNLQPSIFMLGTKPLGTNKWLLKSTNVSNAIANNNGVLLDALLKLEFSEFVRAGSAEASKASGSGGSSSKGAGISADISPTDYIDTNAPTTSKPNPYIYDPVSKAHYKRDNPNAKDSVSSGFVIGKGGRMLE
jgi:hypothetical protein